MKRFRWVACGLLLVTLQSHALSFISTTSNEDEPRETVHTLIVNGVIESGDAGRFSRFIKQESQTSAVAVLLTSSGGALEEIAKMSSRLIEAARLHRARWGRPLLLAVNDECSSACTILVTRLKSATDVIQVWVEDRARIGFHSPVELREGIWGEIADPREREMRFEKMRTAYREAGAPEAWLKKNEAVLRDAKVRALFPRDLCGEGNLWPKAFCLPPGTSALKKISELK